MRRLSLLRSVLLASAAVALAAPSLAAENFKGYYGGLSIGFGQFDTRIHDFDYAWHGDTQTWDAGGTLFGGQLGRNWQSKNTAWGVELDLFASTVDTTYIYSENSTVSSDLNWTGSLRGRAGLAFGETYLYQTFGLAAADYDGSWIYDPAGYDWTDLGDTRFGAVAGFGIEHVTSGDWSFKIEATASKFAREDGFTAPSGGAGVFELGRDDTIYALKFGINNKFGAPRKPDNQIAQGNAFDFSGFFAGLHLGGHQSAVSLTDLDYNDFGGTYQRVGEGVVAGLQAGYNVQNNGFLFGAELQASWLDGDGDFSDVNNPTFSYERATTGSINYTADLRLKAGIAADDTLMYVLGGVALADTDNAHSQFNNGVFNYGVDVSGTNWGFVTGAGIESAITPNLTGRIETTFSAFNGDTSLDTDLDGLYRGHSTDVSVKAGLNYYFGDRGGWGSGAAAPSKWAGWFVGLDGIFAYHEGVFYDRDYEEYGSDYILPSFGGGVGLNAGHNWQDGSFVYGFIADLAIYSNDESEADIGLDYRRMSSSLDWMGSVRGRAGLATGLGHMYATAGFAFAGIDQSHDILQAFEPNDDNFFNDERLGWTVGMGVERMVGGRGSIKLEALYTSFETETAQEVSGETCGPRVCEMDAKDRNVTVKVGYTYKLTGE
jgi:outer membrane immunogenic protein